MPKYFWGWAATGPWVRQKKARLRKARRLLIVPFKTKLFGSTANPGPGVLLAQCRHSSRFSSAHGGSFGGSLPGHAFIAGDQRFGGSGYQYFVVNEVTIDHEGLRHESGCSQNFR